MTLKDLHPKLLTPLSILGFFSITSILILGNTWAFTKGGHDFGVFYTTWKLVLQGDPMGIYKIPTDRFLYIPGFAWLLSPLGLLSQTQALLLWNLFKSFLFIFFLWKESHQNFKIFGLYSLVCLVFARPLLIEFQYGQVNLVVLIFGAWILKDLATNFTKTKPLLWFFFGVVSISKLMTLPLLGLIGLLYLRTPSRLNCVRLGLVFLGFLFILVLPFTSVNYNYLVHLFFEWRGAVTERGIPTDSHNQSFAAFLFHYARGIPTHINSLYMDIKYGWHIFDQDSSIRSMALAWGLAWFTVISVWMIKSSKLHGPRQLGYFYLILAALIIPSHLIWKPYFIFALPWILFVFKEVKLKKRVILSLLFFFVSMNMSTFDFVGLKIAAALEAGALILWSYLVMIYFTSGSLNEKISITNQNTVTSP